MKKNSWFKHYNNAHESDAFKNAFYAQEWTAIAFYWFALETISKHENREKLAGYCAIHERFFTKFVGTNTRGLVTLFTKVNQYFGESMVVTWSKLGENALHNMGETFPIVSPEFVQLFAPKWLELQESRGGKRQAKVEVLTDRRKKREERGKNKEDRIKNKEYNTSFGELVLQAPDSKSLGAKIFESYADAFKSRYGVDPVRNAKVNKNCQEIGSRLGEDAIEVAKFFLTHNDGFYIRAQHPIGSFLRDAESLHTQWQRGRAVTSVDVKNFEKTQSQIKAGEDAVKFFAEEDQ